MISIIYSSKNPNKEFEDQILYSCGLKDKVQIIGYKNLGEYSLTEIYNRGLNESINDIVVFCHDDISIETKQWGSKLLKLFNNNQSFGIIGVAGSKYMPISGKWWENPSKMYGRVKHTHEGKSWLSAYSDDLGQELEKVVVCDGLFFAVDKTKIVSRFDEKVKGFHFYDVDFCFANFIKGIDIGVTTMIRINHKSIGITNDEWESNRKEFSIRWEDELPVDIKRTLRKGERLKILIGCLSFTNFTGSELYTYELAKELIKQGCEVSVCSNIGEPMLSLGHKAGIKMYQLQEPPGFKLGDGKWQLKNNDGTMVTSQEKTVYKMSNIQFDILHLNHKPITEHLLRFYPNTPAICSIHSEVIALEEPVLNDQIKKYIAIRPEIKEYLMDNFQINEDKISVIYNPIDYNKFKKINTPSNSKKRIIFIGTIDYLRKQTIQDLITTTKENNQDLWIIGKKNDSYLDDMMAGSDHVRYIEPTFGVEKYVQQCDETAGILLGRTTIEGWLCGKSGWIYDVNSNGDILSKKLHDIPSDIDKFKSNNVAKEIIEEYKSILQ